MKQMPKIDKYMTALPHTVNANLPIKKAMELMRENRIRHLPVLDGGNLVGVLTDRDIKLATTFQGSDDLRVDEVMTPDPYSTAPEVSLDKVVFEMAEHKYGCAVIRQDNGKVVGIFTATDGLRVLGEMMQNHYKPGVQ